MVLSDDAWSLARRVREWLRARGAWGPIEPLALWLAPRVIPPSPSETTAELGGGLRLIMPPSFPPARSYQDGGYEPQLTRWMTETIREGWVVVDAGANVGYYTLLASRAVGPSGRVFAFEADPTNFLYLVRNIESNRCTNVIPVRLAVTNRSGSFSFSRDRFRAEGHVTEEGSERRGLIGVEGCRIDDFLTAQNVGAVQCMKLDIEGGEPAALRGAAATIRHSPDLKLVLEYNPRALRRGKHTESELFGTLCELGFRRARPIDAPGPEIQLERIRSLDGPSQNLEILR